MKNLRKTKGITLIALVVTIVVLIILAAVSINAVLNDNGVIKKAEQAEEAPFYPDAENGYVYTSSGRDTKNYKPVK